ncbi:succinate dehydrogenase [Deminuibacter soli]|uniref:Succinate dehydrogenase n=2 Tax=Deminuibacter soli TaxID=2291815 RepID=A0A3E1NHV4_9BACT|nr:succinate dehydrogenase [Deminuibacter soli]
MSATGLFLCVFLVIHLLGNLQLLLPAADAKEQFNWYSRLLSGNIIIKVIAWVLYCSIIGHAVYALLLTLQSRRANGTRYVYDKRGASSKWYSRNMGLLGTIILIFLVIHFKDFWYRYKFTDLPLDARGQPDLYTVVVFAFAQWWYVLLYVVCMFAMGFHLLHGFFSAARTLGLYHPKFTRWVKVSGWLYTVVITGGFIIIPIYVYFTNS